MPILRVSTNRQLQKVRAAPPSEPPQNFELRAMYTIETRENDIDVLYRVIVKFVPEVEPEPGELEALLEGREDRKKNGTISHDAINWE